MGISTAWLGLLQVGNSPSGACEAVGWTGEQQGYLDSHVFCPMARCAGPGWFCWTTWKRKALKETDLWVSSWAHGFLFFFRLTEKFLVLNQAFYCIFKFCLVKFSKKFELSEKTLYGEKPPLSQSGNYFFWLVWICNFPAFNFFWNPSSELAQGPRIASIPSKLSQIFFFFFCFYCSLKYLLFSLAVASARYMPMCMLWEQGQGISDKPESCPLTPGLPALVSGEPWSPVTPCPGHSAQRGCPGTKHLKAKICPQCSCFQTHDPRSRHKPHFCLNFHQAPSPLFGNYCCSSSKVCQNPYNSTNPTVSTNQHFSAETCSAGNFPIQFYRESLFLKCFYKHLLQGFS